VAMALEVLGTRRALLRRKVMDILMHVGMQTKMDEYPAALSGGEQQRVAIARALVNEPAIVLADEPTGNLDTPMSRRIIELLSDIRLRGATIIVASHDEELVGRHAERVLRLDRGKLINALTEGRRQL